MRWTIHRLHRSGSFLICPHHQPILWISFINHFLIKRGYKSLLKNPLPFFLKKKRTIKFHFDMHHGYGILDKAIKYVEKKERNDFQKFIEENYSFNPHIMFISKKKIINKY